MSQESKRVLSLLICFVMMTTLVFPIPVAAWDIPDEYDIPIIRLPEEPQPVARGNCGENITWTLFSNGLLSLEGTGAMDDYASASDAPWYRQRTSVTAIRMGDGITSIGDRAFYNFISLCDVTVGADVATVGTYAFRGCVALESITLPESVTQLKNSAFRACPGLAFVRIEGDAPMLGTYVFNEGADLRTLQYLEGSSGYDVSPWTEFTQTTDHAGTWITTVVPSCNAAGSRYIDCSYCQETFTEILTAEHLFVDGVCSLCYETEVMTGGQCGDNAWWKLDVLGTLLITGSGQMEHFGYNHNGTTTAPWYPYHEQIDRVIIHSGITGLGSYAFYDCMNMTDITIPETVTDLGTCALAGCGSLKSITIPESVTNVGNAVFSGCLSLEDVYISDLAGWCQIEFQDSNATPLSCAKNLYLNDTLLTSLVIPEGVTSIGSYAFYSYDRLMDLQIPEGVTGIGNSAFSNCTNLTGVTIPEGMTSIGNSAFWKCTGLTEVLIPESVTAIGDSAFAYCTGLTEMIIPEGVDIVASALFSHCTNLTEVIIPESVTRIASSAFAYCSNLTDVTIPESVTSIGYSAFYNCKSLTSVMIPESVTIIGGSAFYNCISLQSITIPGSVTSIGENAFSDCKSLTEVTIPASVTGIGHDAFSYCSSLETIRFLGSAPTIESYCCILVYATVYYPCNDPTWTSSFKSRFGEGLTWKGHLFDYTYNGGATCTKDGTRTGRCPECGEEETISAPDTALGHTLGNDGLCIICGSGSEIIINIYDDSGTGAMVRIYADDTVVDPEMYYGKSFKQAKIPYAPDVTYTFVWIAGRPITGSCRFEIKQDSKVLMSGIGMNYSDGQTVYTLERAVSTQTLSGSITDFAEGAVTLTLTGNGMEETLSTDTGSYSLTAAPGEYILTVAKANHVTRQYAVTLENGDMTLDVKLHLIGDIDGNGKANTGDVAKLNAHLKGSNKLTDEYMILCANVNGGSLNMGDTAALYAHIRGTKKLY